MGDPSGIGPEIVLKCYLGAASDPLIKSLMRSSFVIGDEAHLQRAAHSLGEAANRIRLQTITGLEQLEGVQFSNPPDTGVVLVPVMKVPKKGPSNDSLAPLGKPSKQAGRIAAENIIWGAQAALRKEICALVTAPIHKQSLAMAGIAFPGHTEMLQNEAALFLGVEAVELPVKMMLASEELKVVLVSIHVSLKDAISMVTQPQIIETLEITHTALKSLLGRTPRIGVAGLNPHAGEGGLMGREELEIIEPAIQLARAQNNELQVSGPHAPDTIFMRARTGEFDVVIAMYHDQGLIPVKYMGLDKGVNVTLGLPLVRTSPDHGTAFEIVGKGVADASSMLQAIKTARLLCNLKNAP